MQMESKVQKIAEILPAGQEESRATELRKERNDSQMFAS